MLGKLYTSCLGKYVRALAATCGSLDGLRPIIADIRRYCLIARSSPLDRGPYVISNYQDKHAIRASRRPDGSRELAPVVWTAPRGI